MAAHKYWRVYVDANNGDSYYASIAEVEFRAEIGGTDQCSGGQAIANGYSPGGAPSNAFDNVLSTAWFSPAYQVNDTWIGYQFVAPVAVAEVALTATTAIYRAPKNFRIQYSDDGSVWEDYSIVTGQTGWGAQEQRLFVTSEPATYEIVGTVSLDGLPHQAIVRAHKTDGTVASETQSDSGTGAYTLSGLEPDTDYYVVVTPATGVRPKVHGPVQSVESM